MGGLAEGVQAAGFDIRWASDIDSHAASSFRHRFAEVRYLERDVRELHVTDDQLDSVDLLAGGFPCQSFSVAGEKFGFDDERGKLFYEIPRLITEWRAALQPKLLLLENVPYLMHGDRSWFDEIRRALRQAGYWFREESCWMVNLREWTGVPQDRTRLYLVAASREHFSFNPFTPPPPVSGCALTEARTIYDIVDRSARADESDYLPEGNKYREMIEASIARAQSPRNLFQLRRNEVREKRDGLCPTLTANMGEGGHNVPFIQDQWGIRRLRVREVAQLQGFQQPEADLFPETVPTNKRYRLLGNAACPKLAELAAIQCRKALKEVQQCQT